MPQAIRDGPEDPSDIAHAGSSITQRAAVGCLSDEMVLFIRREWVVPKRLAARDGLLRLCADDAAASVFFANQVPSPQSPRRVKHLAVELLQQSPVLIELQG